VNTSMSPVCSRASALCGMFDGITIT
jgi:hypothetical protein